MSMQKKMEEFCIAELNQSVVESDVQQCLETTPTLKNIVFDFNRAKDFLLLYESCNNSVQNVMESASTDCNYWRKVALLLAAQMIKSRPGTLLQQLAAAQKVWLTQASHYILGLGDYWTKFVKCLKNVLNEGKGVLANLLNPLQQFVCTRHQAVSKFASTLQLTLNHYQHSIKVGCFDQHVLQNLKGDLEVLASAWALCNETHCEAHQNLQLAIKSMGNVQVWFDRCRKIMSSLWSTFPMQKRLEELVSLLLKEESMFIEDLQDINIENAVADMVNTLPIMKSFAASSAEMDYGVIVKIHQQMGRWVEGIHLFQQNLSFDQQSERMAILNELQVEAQHHLHQWDETIVDVLQKDLSAMSKKISAVQISLERWLVDVLIWLCSSSPASDPESNLTCISQKITLSMLEQRWQNLKRQLADVTHEMVARLDVIRNVISKKCVIADSIKVNCRNLETACRGWLANSDEVIRAVRESAVFKKPDVEELVEMQRVLHHLPFDIERLQAMLSTFGYNGQIHSEKLAPAVDTLMEYIGNDGKTRKNLLYKTCASGNVNDSTLLHQLQDVQALQEQDDLMNKGTAKRVLELEEELCVMKERLHLAEVRLAAADN